MQTEQPKPQVTDYEEEAVQSLVRSELMRGPGTDPERIHSALEGIGWAILSLKESTAVTAMLDHCAENDHLLSLRLVDTDVFAVHCTSEMVPGRACTFRTEWRT